MENKQVNPKGILKTLSIIHAAMTFGLFAIGFLYYTSRDEWISDFSDVGYLFPYGVPAVMSIGIIVGRMVFNHHLKSTKVMDGLGSKLGSYMTASLVKYAFLEGPGILAFIAAEATGNMAYLIFGGLMVLMMILERPYRQKVEVDLDLNRELKMEFDKAMQDS